MMFSSHRLVTALSLACGLVLVASPTLALAQTLPVGGAADAVDSVQQDRAVAPTAESGLPNGAVAPATKKPLRKPAKFEHLILSPTLDYSMSSGSDVNRQTPGRPPNDLPVDLLRLTGTAVYRFNKHLGVQYVRIEHVGAGGRTYKKGVASYGGNGEDYQDRILAAWTFNPYLTFRTGYHYRARICCPGAGDPNGIPRFLGGNFNDLTWRFGRPGLGGKPLTISVNNQNDYHRFTAEAQKNLARGEFDHGQKPTFGGSLYANFYVFHQTKLVPYGGLEYLDTYFSNSPRASIIDRKVFGVLYRATSDLSWKFYVKNDQPNGQSGAGNGSHKSAAFLDLTYRIHR